MVAMNMLDQPLPSLAIPQQRSHAHNSQLLPSLGLSPAGEDSPIVVMDSADNSGSLDPPIPAPGLPQADARLPEQGLQSRNQEIPKFPTNIRHRRSNIAVQEPEIEFQKAALDACRSTIVQQEAEIKRLHEGTDIRDKKIMHLESQVNVSTSYISSRDQPQMTSSYTATQATDQLTNILSTLNLLITKLSLVADHQVPKSPSVNVYNSHCSHQKPVMVSQSSQTSEFSTTNPEPTIDMDLDSSSPTEPGPVMAETEDVLTCTLCGLILESKEELEAHIGNIHDKPPAYKCDHCTKSFSSRKLIDLHISEKHHVDYIQCSYCKLRVQNKSQLDEHMKESHVTHTATPSSASTAMPGGPSSVAGSSSAGSLSSSSPKL